jgi:replication factor C subunit 3/5
MNYNKDFLPWVEKYRPEYMNDIISHDQNIQTIKKLLINNSLPHLLFYGFPGTGKTSTIMALTKEIYGKNAKLMIMKLDASDDRGINSVREDIKGFAEKADMFIKGVRLIILDEADSMTFDAQFALRRIIEKYSLIIRFCLICNYENKIIPALRSRCANFRFGSIDVKHISSKLESIAINEKINYDKSIISTIAYLAKGDLRKAINIFQSLAMSSIPITVQNCYEIISIPYKDDILKHMYMIKNKTKSNNEIYYIINKYISSNNYSLNSIISEILVLLLENNSILLSFISSLEHFILELANLEFMLTKISSDNIYISYFISILIQNIY